jgi:hypothetical protein
VVGGFGLPVSFVTGLSTRHLPLTPFDSVVFGFVTDKEATMVNSTPTSSAIAQSSVSPKSTHTVTLRAVAMSLSMPAAVEPPAPTKAELMREEVESLCSNMLWLRNWWAMHCDGIRAADRQAAASIDSHFVDGAIFARSIAKKAGFDLGEDRMKNYSWGRNTQTMSTVVRGAK